MIVTVQPARRSRLKYAVVTEIVMLLLCALTLLFDHDPSLTSYANNLLLLGFIVMILGLIRGIGWHTQRSCMEVNMFTSGVHHFKDVAKPRYVRGDVKIGTIVFLLGLFNLLLGGLLLMP